MRLRVHETLNNLKAQGFVPYDTCMPYLACSDDSDEGFCSAVDTSCSKHNVCRTCSTFSSMGGTCSEVKSCFVVDCRYFL
jgi:cathepsin X